MVLFKSGLLIPFQMISQERGFLRSTNLPPQRCSPTWTLVCPPQESSLGSRWICLTHHHSQAYNTFILKCGTDVSNTMCLSQMSHAATSALCRSIKLQCELYPSRQIAICLDPYCGLGFALWCLCRWETGHANLTWRQPKPHAYLQLGG